MLKGRRTQRRFSAEHLMRIFVSHVGNEKPGRGSRAYRAVQDLFSFNKVILNMEEFASILKILKYGNTALVSNVFFIIFMLNPLIELYLLYCNNKLLSHWATIVQFDRWSPVGQPGIYKE